MFEFPDTILSQDEHGFFRWFAGGKLNTSYLALDAQIEDGRGDQLALIYDSPVSNSQRKYTYTELRDEVTVFAGGLKNLGVHLNSIVSDSKTFLLPFSIDLGLNKKLI